MSPQSARGSKETWNFLLRMRWGALVAAPVMGFLSGRATWTTVAGVICLLVYLGLLEYFSRRVDVRRLYYPALLIDIALVSALVVGRGGLRSDVYHFYYIVIVEAAMLLGPLPAVATGTASGVAYYISALLGAAPGVEAVSWSRILIRTIYFIFVGAVSGYLAQLESEHRQEKEEKERLLTDLREAHAELKAYAAEISQLAVTDGLTKLYNHSYFQQRLQQEIKRAERYGFPLCLLMIDLDNFKQYNDTFGHVRGNDLLCAIARALRESVRQVDIVARYGGEEFVVILPETHEAGGRLVAERIREKAEGLVAAVTAKAARAETAGAAAGAAPGSNLPSQKVTVSVGAAVFPDHAKDRTDLIEKADRAMYAAKRRGRNLVVVYDGAVKAPEGPAVGRTSGGKSQD